MLKETLRNLYRLTEFKVITSNMIALYMRIRLDSGSSFNIISLRNQLSLSETIIRKHLDLLEKIGCIKRERYSHKPQKIFALDLSKEKIDQILEDTTRLSSLYKYKDNKINKYHLKSFFVDNYNKRIIIRERETSDVLKSVIEGLPDQYLSFRVTPRYMQLLDKVAATINIKKYIAWFVSKKLGKSVKTFSLGIFLYPGILKEYKLYILRFKKQERYKDIKSRKALFDEGAKRLERELKNETVL